MVSKPQSHLRPALALVTGIALSNPMVAMLAPVAVAQPLNCKNPQTQFEMTQCAGLAWQRSDRELNRVYQQLTPTLSTIQRQNLTTAQRQWIKFRDTECRFADSLTEGGTMQPMLNAGCKDQLTQQRTADLKAYQRLNAPSPTGNSYPQADRSLNQTYRQLRQSLRPDRKPKLETAQLAWIAFRDAACTFEDSLGNPRDRCRTRLTEQRDRQLKNHLETP